MTIKFKFKGCNQDGTQIQKAKTYKLKQTRTSLLLKEIEDLESDFDRTHDFDGESDDFTLSIEYNGQTFDTVGEVLNYIREA
jgi:hypothetical protein